MPESIISIIRWFFFIGAVMSFLQATVLFAFFQRFLFKPWFRMNERMGASIPSFMRDPRFQRAWPLFMAVVLGTLWWISGTPAGHAWLRAAG
jgi:hypothetical protein